MPDIIVNPEPVQTVATSPGILIWGLVEIIIYILFLFAIIYIISKAWKIGQK